MATPKKSFMQKQTTFIASLIALFLVIALGSSS